MDEQSVTQVELARRMGCSQQYVSNLLKGSSNMTLETIGRLEKALDIDILRTTLCYVYEDSADCHSPRYLNEPSSPEDTVPDGTISQRHLEDSIRCNPSSLGKKAARTPIGYR